MLRLVALIGLCLSGVTAAADQVAEGDLTEGKAAEPEPATLMIAASPSEMDPDACRGFVRFLAEELEVAKGFKSFYVLEPAPADMENDHVAVVFVQFDSAATGAAATRSDNYRQMLSSAPCPVTTSLLQVERLQPGSSAALSGDET